MTPTTVTQTAGTDTVSWHLEGATPWSRDGNRCGTTQPLGAHSSAAGLTGQKNTHTLLWSGWPMTGVTGTVTGISVRIYAEKNRVRDQLVQLHLDGALIGSNRASESAGHEHVYGGDTDMWGTQLTLAQLPNIKVALVYQSGSMPHSDHAYVDTVLLQINYTP
jgi:hypothetical protein